ncbi:unnamed protein product [Ophioblennius macclurei]
MQASLFIVFTLVSILVANSNDENWQIDVNRRFQEPSGSTIIIQCNFSYPMKYYTPDVKVYWKMDGTSNCSRTEKDKRAFVYHKKPECIHKDYRGKTDLIGDPARGNCTLMIRDVVKNESKIYMRIYARNQSYSFSMFGVNITVTDAAIVPHVAIAVPVVVVVVVVVILVAGITLAVKRKRSRSFTREESGYYANFSRFSADVPPRKLSDMTAEQKLTEPKVIDEPVYVNLEAPTTAMSHDPNEHLYGNVDYTK